MKKNLIRFGITLVIILFIGLWQIGSIISGTVEEFGPAVVGADIKLGSVSVNPFAGRLTISDFILGNPKGFKTDNAMAFEKVYVDLSLTSLLSDTIVIDKIEIAAPQITFEGGLTESNLGRIQKNIEDFLGSSDEPSAAETTTETEENSAPGKDVQIREFVMTDAKVKLSVKLLQGAAAPIIIKEIRHENIGTEDGGIGAGKAVGLVFSTVFQAVFSDVSALLTNIGDGVEAAGKGVLEGGKKVGEGILEGGKTVGDGVKDLGKGIKDIFK